MEELAGNVKPSDHKTHIQILWGAGRFSPVAVHVQVLGELVELHEGWHCTCLRLKVTIGARD